MRYDNVFGMENSNIGKRRLADIQKRFDIPFKCTEVNFTKNGKPFCHRCTYTIDDTGPRYFHISFYKNRTHIGGVTKSQKWVEITVTSKSFYKIYQFIDFMLKEYENF